MLQVLLQTKNSRDSDQFWNVEGSEKLQRILWREKFNR